MAYNCDEYKKSPDINIEKSQWKININKSQDDLWPKAGYVNVMPFHQIAPKIAYSFNGKYFCVFLDSVDVTVGFYDFDIYIDKKYKKDSCEYNAVLEHENHHINDAVKAFDKIFPEIEKDLYDVVKDIQPIYTENVDDVPVAVDKIRDEIIKSEKLHKLEQKFQEQQKHDAEILDGTPDEMLKKCTLDKVNAAFDKYFKKKEIKNEK